MVNVAATSFGMIERLQQITGCGRVTQRKHDGHPYHHSYWEIHWRKDEICSFLPLIIPYLVVKKKHAEVLLEYFKLSSNPHRLWHVNDQERWLKMLALHKKMRSLIQRQTYRGLSTVSPVIINQKIGV